MAIHDAAVLPVDGRCVQVAVVGAGPAGLATAACLRRAGVAPLILERARRVGDRWRGHYDVLHLHTARVLSGLPGMRIPPSAGQWVSRDELAAYLEGYARHHGLDIRTGVTAGRVEPATAGGWTVRTDAGDVKAQAVVVAAGYAGRPYLPAWPGRPTFRGELLHSSAYCHAGPFRERDVLVVGTGNSGSEIAADLARGGARRVFVAVRTAPNIIPRALFGVPIQFAGVALSRLPPRAGDPVVRLVQRAFVGDLRDYGLARPPRGVATQFAAGDTVPVLDVGLVAALRARRVTPVAAVTGFADDRVELADGTRLAVDVVIAATGYRAGLEGLAGGLGVLDARGLPRVHGAALRDLPGLYFVGYNPTIAGHLYEIRREAMRTARDIARTSAGAAQARVAAGAGVGSEASAPTATGW